MNMGKGGFLGLLAGARYLRGVSDFSLGRWSMVAQKCAEVSARRLDSVLEAGPALALDSRSFWAKDAAQCAYRYGRYAKLCMKEYERRLARRAREGKGHDANQ